ncbi:MAG: antitoxin Xre-like helix-turn-helix domain-containing protein [Pseudomonadota bacterium]
MTVIATSIETPETGKIRVGLKAFARISESWSLTQSEAADLMDMSLSTWKRAKKPDFTGDLTHDQRLRLSALIGLYKAVELYFDPPLSTVWAKRPNTGPEFDGTRPIDAMVRGGLPKILRVRRYMDALRGGM